MPRRARLLASVVTAGLLLAGCGAGNGRPGAAAIVGDASVPVSEVQSWFDGVLRKEPQLAPQLREQGQLDELGRRVASQLVLQRLTDRAARDEHLAVAEQQVTDLINGMGGPEAATAGKIYTADDVREVARAQLLAGELGRRYYDRLGITFDYTQATNRREAETKARRMAEGQDQAAALVDADRRAGTPAAAGQRLRATDSAQLAAGTPLFGAAPGTVLAFEPQPNAGQWLVVRIRERRTDEPPVRGAADDRTLQEFGTRLLGFTADRVGVRLSPRYGTWDPIRLAAAPNSGEVSGFRITERSAAS